MNQITSIERLDSLEEHQTILQQVLSTARERVLIVSPYISISVIDSENIAALVTQAVARGVRVQVFVDSQQNCYRTGAMKERAMEGIVALVEAGAQVAVCNGIQRKVLARDCDLYAEGGFNWLSATLIRNGERPLEEGTTVYTGENAALKISQELVKIEETEYEFATASEGGGLEVTRLGKILGLFLIIVVPIQIGRQLGNIMAGFISTGLILAVVISLYFLRSKRCDAIATVQ
jgi:hypothetical protein